MMLAAHLFARTPADGAADEATFEDALAGALLDADGELHGRGDALTVSQRRAIAALPAAKHRSARRPRANTGTSKDATSKALAALAQAADIAQDPTAATGWMIIDPLTHEWLRQRGRD
jgi:hypothetical protein